MSYPRIHRGDMAADVLQRDFTQIHNRLFRDPRLTFKAKGIFGLISTHRDGYGVTPEWIAAAGADGPSAVKTGLRELEKFGYLDRTQHREPDGTMGPMTYSITDMPRSKPVDEKPPAVEPPAADVAHKKINSKKTGGENTTPFPAVDEPAAPSVPQQERGGHAPHEDRATALVDSLPYAGRLPGRKTRETLIRRTADALRAGWGEKALRTQLTTGTGGAKSLAHVYGYRLHPDQLPDPQTVAVAAAADATPTPAPYTPEPPREVGSAVDGAARVRANMRPRPRGRDHRPYVPR